MSTKKLDPGPQSLEGLVQPWWNPFHTDRATMLTHLSPRVCRQLLAQELEGLPFTPGSPPRLYGTSRERGFQIRCGISYPHGSRPTLHGDYHESERGTVITLRFQSNWNDCLSNLIGLVAVVALTSILLVRTTEWIADGNSLILGVLFIVGTLAIPLALAAHLFVQRWRHREDARSLAEFILVRLQGKLIAASW